MNRESVNQLRNDRRLLFRRGWITPQERERAIGELPDVASKATTLGEAIDDREGPAPAAAGETATTGG